MADRVVPGPVSNDDCIKEAVCIDTRKIMDSCRDKDCVEELRVYPTVNSVPLIQSAFSVRPRCAELLQCEVSVKEICLNRGYYTVDVTYFYKVTGEVFPSNQTVTGLAVFDKRVMLFGSEGSVKSFSSNATVNSADSSMPYAVVDAVDPIALHMTLSDTAVSDPGIEQRDIPEAILSHFDDELSFASAEKTLYVTLGQFSIIRLLRTTQLLIPAYDYCLPEKECVGASEDDPCTMFGRIRFPVEEFFPPDAVEECDEYKSLV